MSDLFPDKPEYRVIPTYRLRAKYIVVGSCVASALSWPCPKVKPHHDHAAEKQHVEYLVPVMTVAANAGGVSGDLNVSLSESLTVVD
jgi:hypothetical protein